MQSTYKQLEHQEGRPIFPTPKISCDLAGSTAWKMEWEVVDVAKLRNAKKSMSICSYFKHFSS